MVIQRKDREVKWNYINGQNVLVCRRKISCKNKSYILTLHLILLVNKVEIMIVFKTRLCNIYKCI